MKIIGRGAEAILYLNKDKVIKKRTKKSYRHPELDESLRKFRTKREVKVLSKLKQVPKVINSDQFSIEMDYVKGDLLRDIFDKKGLKYCEQTGKIIKDMHDKGIIHGDLTTSNIIIGKEICFIDFGLSFFSDKVEDKAVDLHLLKQALTSKHYKNWRDAFDLVWKGYNPDKQFIDRFYKVESRGRYKRKK